MPKEKYAGVSKEHVCGGRLHSKEHLADIQLSISNSETWTQSWKKTNELDLKILFVFPCFQLWFCSWKIRHQTWGWKRQRRQVNCLISERIMFHLPVLIPRGHLTEYWCRDIAKETVVESLRNKKNCGGINIPEKEIWLVLFSDWSDQ